MLYYIIVAGNFCMVQNLVVMAFMDRSITMKIRTMNFRSSTNIHYRVLVGVQTTYSAKFKTTIFLLKELHKFFATVKFSHYTVCAP